MRARSRASQAIKERWDYFHVAYHAAGFILNPGYHDMNHSDNASNMRFMRTVISRLYHDQPEKATRARQQLTEYLAHQGAFSEPGIFDDAKCMADYMWGLMYGGGVPELKHVALKVLSKKGNASQCERNWSLFDFIWSKKRNSLRPEKATRLVRVHSNLVLLGKRKHVDFERTHNEINAMSDDDDSASSGAAAAADDDDDEEGGVLAARRATADM